MDVRPMVNHTMSQAIVIGGGIVGTSVAYHLVRDGVDTLLVDRQDEGRATEASSGILSPPTSTRSDLDVWFEFAIDAVGYYPTFIDEIETEQDGRTGYVQSGLLSVAYAADSVDEFDATLTRAHRRSERLGYPDPDAIYEVSPEQAQQRCPLLAAPKRAFYYEDAARLHGGLLTEAIRRAGEPHGLALHRGSAEEIHVDDGEVTGVTVDGTERDADIAIVAGGAWSAAFGDQLGVDIPVEPMRGQIVDVDLGSTDVSAWPIVTSGGASTLIPWWDGRVAVSSTKEPGSGFTAHPTVAGVHTLLDGALEMAPAIGDATIDGTRVGLRPATPDHLPVIGPILGIEGAYVATGHGTTGLQLGPYTGKLIADVVVERTPDADLTPFSPSRFEAHDG